MIGILGYGEVGQAIAQCYRYTPLIKDLNRDEIKNQELEVLHVCIPWSETFLEDVKKIKTELVIIHSTVPVGTTELIPNAVHSPVRGIHPFLFEGLKTFIKFVGTNDEELGRLAVKHLEFGGMRCEPLKGTRTTELGKLLDTTYYGVCIEFHRYAKELCDEYGLNFEDVMTKFNQSYNEGYTFLKKTNVIRPVLIPPQGEIGGHCIRQNAKLLTKKFEGGNLWK